ncbi:MAG: hypothetical protein OEQ81_08180 [Flavobacteriaceae bacterium]|nr:hypothetical protein [Flavobacteriaceae bacterium]
MKQSYIYGSLTRISDLQEKPFDVEPQERSAWATGDYILSEIFDAGGNDLQIELPSGRMRGVIGGDLLVGALGERFATLEVTGSWKEVDGTLKMNVLTAAGLLGKLTSKSVFIPQLMQIRYLGHVVRNGKKVCMEDFIKQTDIVKYSTPTVLFMGTSMSAGKTTSARIVTNLFKTAGYKVVAAKLSGAGRYKDILALKDGGADAIFDFVDVGLPSTIVSPELYKERLPLLLSMIQSVKADIAVIEIGASPLEPYNGDVAYKAIKDQLACTILSASDPYAVYGLMKAFELKPDIVSGITSNTEAGRQLVRTLCDVEALNLIDPKTTRFIKHILEETTGLKFEGRESYEYH